MQRGRGGRAGLAQNHSGAGGHIVALRFTASTLHGPRGTLGTAAKRTQSQCQSQKSDPDCSVHVFNVASIWSVGWNVSRFAIRP